MKHSHEYITRSTICGDSRVPEGSSLNDYCKFRVLYILSSVYCSPRPRACHTPSTSTTWADLGCTAPPATVVGPSVRTGAPHWCRWRSLVHTASPLLCGRTPRCQPSPLATPHRSSMLASDPYTKELTALACSRRTLTQRSSPESQPSRPNSYTTRRFFTKIPHMRSRQRFARCTLQRSEQPLWKADAYWCGKSTYSLQEPRLRVYIPSSTAKDLINSSYDTLPLRLLSARRNKSLMSSGDSFRSCAVHKVFLLRAGAAFLKPRLPVRPCSEHSAPHRRGIKRAPAPFKQGVHPL
eukprot:4950084-Pyramimonas_sp.AAC.2